MAKVKNINAPEEAKTARNNSDLITFPDGVIVINASKSIIKNMGIM